MVAAISGGLFIGIAGIQHVIKKPISFNEKVAMISNIFIFFIMITFIIYSLQIISK